MRYLLIDKHWYPVHKEGSYFETCERDDSGHCKPSGQGRESGGRKPPKKPAADAKPRTPAEEADHPGVGKDARVKVKKSKERAFKGEPVPLKMQLTKQETGRVGEKVAVAWLKSLGGVKDAVPLNTGNPSESIDLFGDSMAPEVKSGLASNGKDAQKWRITFSMEVSKEEKAAYDAMTKEQRTAYNAKKQKDAMARKVRLLEKLGKRRGKPIRPVTVTTIINPDTQTADIYMAEGYHQILRWNDPKAKYQGSVKYDHA